MEASTAPAAAEAIVAALVQTGTRLMFGVPGGGPNLDVVGEAEAAGIRFVLAHGETGSDGRPNLTPVWFDYEGEVVLLNLATHRKKVPWLRKVPYATFILMNPENTYHWLSLKTEVRREISEDDPAEGQRVTDQLDRIWVKYTGNEPPYALRDPSMDERRVLFELEVVKVATFGRP